jgi:O-antigen/teichoic acid export membrane protein
MPVSRPTDVPKSGAPEEGIQEEPVVEPIKAPPPPRLGRVHGLAGKSREITPYALGLVILRTMSIGAKFALTLFIARYLGLAPLGIYGIITSAAIMAPVLLGFGVSNNLAREAARSHAAAVTPRLVQYLALLIPAYAALGVLGIVAFRQEAIWLCLLAALLYFEHVQTDLFAVMTVNGHAFGANLIFFIRFSAWALIYMPLALFEPALRSLKVMGLFWLVADVLATIVAVLLTPRWRWGDAVRALPRSPIVLPHRHGSTALYLNDVANTGFQYVDRYIIGIVLSPELLGIYTLFWSIVNATSNLITTVIIQPRRGDLIQVARFSSRTFNHALVKVANSASQVAIGLSAAMLVLMYFAMPYIHRTGLMAYYPVLFILCVGLVFRTYYEVIGISFYAYSRDDITLYSGMIILIASISLNVLLVPMLGIWAASSVLLASYAIGVLARGIIISRGFRPHASSLETVPERL